MNDIDRRVIYLKSNEPVNQRTKNVNSIYDIKDLLVHDLPRGIYLTQNYICGKKGSYISISSFANQLFSTC